MRTNIPNSLAWIAATTLAVMSSACGVAPSLTSTAAPAPTPAPAAPATLQSTPETGDLVFATLNGVRTEQGGAVEAFAYAEKTGDASLGKLSFADGMAVVNGAIWPQKGSTWAGLALTVTGTKAADMTSYKSVTIQLAGAGQALRIRLMGNDKSTRDNGCYPVLVQPVTPEARSYTLDLSRFSPEGYCGGNGRSAAAALSALTAIEVADARVSGAGRRDINFRVGRIVFNR